MVLKDLLVLIQKSEPELARWLRNKAFAKKAFQPEFNPEKPRIEENRFPKVVLCLLYAH